VLPGQPLEEKCWMVLLYNSDNFAVMQLGAPGTVEVAPSGDSLPPVGERGGYEIVDKFACRGIYIEGAVAQRFRDGVEALVRHGPDAEALDEFIDSFAVCAQQRVCLH
jgi:hypothetical protein